MINLDSLLINNGFFLLEKSTRTYGNRKITGSICRFDPKGKKENRMKMVGADHKDYDKFQDVFVIFSITKFNEYSQIILAISDEEFVKNLKNQQQ